MAWHYKQFQSLQSAIERQEYGAAEAVARRAHIGLWAAIARITQSWQKKTHMWRGDGVKRKREEERLWFRGQPAAAKLSPRIYRTQSQNVS
jgi:hypothetical protein